MVIITNPNQFPISEITVQTRKGNDIKNVQCKIPLTLLLKYERDLEKKYPSFKLRSKPSGMYNCFGLVFASRRTTVEDLSEIPKILAEDNYVEIKNHKEVLPGDIVLYKTEDDIPHAGIVVSRPNGFGYPLICSKWGVWGEVLHYANDCPPYYPAELVYYRIQR